MYCRTQALVILGVLVMTIGCDVCKKDSREPIGWHKGESCLTTTNSIARINQTIGDANVDPEVRKRAVAELFANHIRPGARSEDMHDIIINTEWIMQSEFIRPDVIGGWIPINMSTGGSLCIVDPFVSNARRKSSSHHALKDEVPGPSAEWSICILFTEEMICYTNGEKLFFKAAITNEDVRLEAFTLCIPGYVSPPI